MSEKKKKLTWAEEVLVAFKAAVKLAIKKHHKAGRKVPVMGKDGKIEWV